MTQSFQRWMAVAAVSIGSFSSLLSSTTIDVAFSPLMAHFGMSMETAQWTITLYMIVMTIAMLLAADMVKRIGVRATSDISFVIFTIGCILGGIADSVEMLFFGRVLQGIAAGLQTPLAAIVVTKSFPQERIGYAMGIFGSVMLLAPALGPVIGGLLIDQSSWRMLFYFQVPLAIFSLFAGHLALSKGEISTKGRYDWSGLIILSISMCSLFAAMKFYRSHGVDSALFFITCTLSMITLVAFLQNEKKAINPLVDLNIFGISPFSINLIIIYLLGAGMFSSILLIPFYLIETLHYTPGQAGMALLPAGIIMAVSAPIAGRLADRYTPPYIIIPSLVIFALSGFFLSEVKLDSTIGFIVIGAVISRIGLSFLLPSLYSSTLRHLKGQYTEYGSSLMNFARQLGGSTGVMFFSAKFAELAERHQGLVSSENLGQSIGQYREVMEDAFIKVDVGNEQYGQLVLSKLAEQPKQVAEFFAFTNIFYIVGFSSLGCILLWLASFAASKRHAEKALTPAA